MYALSIVLLLSALGLFPGFIAQRRGYSFALWWLYGALLFVIALPHSLILRNKTVLNDGMAFPGGKTCPYCQESVQLEDDICPFCHLHLYDPTFDGPGISGQMTHRHA